MSDFTGFVEGFNQERDRRYQENFQREQQNRAMADRVFATLLNSRDPDMQMLAMQGMAAPVGRKKGLKGYFGGVEDKSRPYYDQILQRANELVPDERPAARPTQPQPSTGSGSAGMSTNQMTRPGSAPPMMPPSPTGQLPGQSLPMEQPPSTNDFTGVDAAMPPDQPGMAPQGVGMPPPEPPVSRWKRRGTGVPTAEEIAEASGKATMRGRISGATGMLGELGASPEQQRSAALGIAGAPQSANEFAQGTMGVKTPDGKVHPVSFNRATGKYAFPDGSPVPADAELVSMRAGGSSSSQTGKLPDTPAGRQSLIAMGADPQEIAAGSPTGYWKYKAAQDGTILVGPDMYTPPPNNIGTTQVLDAQGNPAVVGIPRNAAPGAVIGTAPNPQPSTGQSSAAALLEDVKAAITAAETPRLTGMGKKMLSPQQRDALVKQRATAAGLPYQSYFELEQATRMPAARQQTPRANAPAGPAPGTPPVSAADKVREYLLQQRRGGGAPPPAPAAPVGP